MKLAPWESQYRQNQRRKPLISEDTKAKIFMAIFTILVGLFVWAYVQMNEDGSICDTPMGARDFRCMGHFNNNGNQRGRR